MTKKCKKLSPQLAKLKSQKRSRKFRLNKLGNSPIAECLVTMKKNFEEREANRLKAIKDNSGERDAVT